MSSRFLTALPVFNEAPYVDRVLDEVLRYSPEVLVVDDGSTDGTSARLALRSDVQVVAHPENMGYGAALRTAFRYAADQGYEVLVTIDCDGQHEPQRIPRFVSACRGVDVVSGSRYLKQYEGDSQPPAQRRWINQQITAELNRRLGFKLTDAFCGFKAYRVASLRKLQITETGYAMPLEVWTQLAKWQMNVIELPVPLIYLDETRTFGGALDQAAVRLNYYHDVLDQSITRAGLEGSRPWQRSACGESRG